MTSVMNLYWLNDDIRDMKACTRYILFKCCKKTKVYKLGEDIPDWERSVITEYKPMDFMDFKWIIDRCNFELSKDFGTDLLPNSFLSWYQDGHFVPEYFDDDFTCEYKRQKNGKYKKVQSNSIESDFISAAEVWAMNKVIRRWKIYGKWCVKLSNLYYKIKWKLKSEK